MSHSGRGATEFWRCLTRCACCATCHSSGPARGQAVSQEGSWHWSWTGAAESDWVSAHRRQGNIQLPPTFTHHSHTLHPQLPLAHLQAKPLCLPTHTYQVKGAVLGQHTCRTSKQRVRSHIGDKGNMVQPSCAAACHTLSLGRCPPDTHVGWCALACYDKLALYFPLPSLLHAAGAQLCFHSSP